MIVDGPLHARGMLLAVWKPLAALTLPDLAVTAGYGVFGLGRVIPQDVPMPLLGTGLVVFLGMRNSPAYARLWEARTMWARWSTSRATSPEPSPRCCRSARRRCGAR